MSLWHKSYWALLLALIGGVFAGVSLVKYPNLASVTITPPPNTTKISWNSSYGYNEAQSTTSRDNLVFGRWNIPDQIKFETDDGKPPVFFDVKKTKQARHGRILIQFILGLIGISAVFFSVAFHLFKLWKIRTSHAGRVFFFSHIGMLGLFVLILLGAYPGYINIYNSLGQILAGETGHLLPQDSPLLTQAWILLYEVIPSFYFVEGMQALVILVFLLALHKKLFLDGSRRIQMASAVFVAILVFNPVSLRYFFFLDRNITNAWVVFFAVATAWSLMISKRQNVAWWELPTWLLAAIAIRVDNLPFALLLLTVAAVKLRSRTILLQTGLVAIGCFAIWGPIFKWTVGNHDMPTTQTTFVIDTLTPAFVDTIKTTKLQQLSDVEIQTLNKFWKVEEIHSKYQLFSPFGSFDFSRAPSSTSADEVKNLLSFGFKHWQMLLRSRLKFTNHILLQRNTLFDYTSVHPSPESLRELKNSRALPKDLNIGIRGVLPPESLSFWIPNLYFCLAVVIILISLAKWAPGTALCILGWTPCLMVRFIFAPYTVHFYLFDMFLIAAFFPLLAAVEFLKRDGRRESNLVPSEKSPILEY